MFLGLTECNAGVMQECVISSKHFNLLVYSSYRMRLAFKDWINDFPIVGKRTSNFRYAGDIIIIDTNKNNIELR